MRTLLGALVLAAAGCVSADDCAMAIPDAQRADVIRYVIDRELVQRNFVPRDHYALAMSAGRPYATLTEEERTALARHAAGYASCIRETVNKERF